MESFIKKFYLSGWKSREREAGEECKEEVIRLLQLLAREREGGQRREGRDGGRRERAEEQRREGQRESFRCPRRSEENEGDKVQSRGVEDIREERSSNTSSECCSSKERGLSKERGRSRERQSTISRVSSLSLGRTPSSHQRGCHQNYHTLSKPLRHSSSQQEPSFHSLSGTSTRKPENNLTSTRKPAPTSHQKQGSACPCHQCLV